jgi:hypothetical protein
MFGFPLYLGWREALKPLAMLYLNKMHFSGYIRAVQSWGKELHFTLSFPCLAIFFLIEVFDYLCVFGMKEWLRGAPYPWVSPRSKQDGPANEVGRPGFRWRPSQTTRWSGTPSWAPKERYVTAANLCFQFGSFTLEIGFPGLLFCCSTYVLLLLMYLCMKGNLAQFVFDLEKHIFEWLFRVRYKAFKRLSLYILECYRCFLSFCWDLAIYVSADVDTVSNSL